MFNVSIAKWDTYNSIHLSLFSIAIVLLICSIVKFERDSRLFFRHRARLILSAAVSVHGGAGSDAISGSSGIGGVTIRDGATGRGTIDTGVVFDPSMDLNYDNSLAPMQPNTSEPVTTVIAMTDEEDLKQLPNVENVVLLRGDTTGTTVIKQERTPSVPDILSMGHLKKGISDSSEQYNNYRHGIRKNPLEEVQEHEDENKGDEDDNNDNDNDNDEDEKKERTPLKSPNNGPTIHSDKQQQQQSFKYAIEEKENIRDQQLYQDIKTTKIRPPIMNSERDHIDSNENGKLVIQISPDDQKLSQEYSPLKKPLDVDLSSYAINPTKHRLKLTGTDMTSEDRAELEKYLETRRKDDIMWYNNMLSKTKKYGKHYYSKRYENEGLDGFRRHVTLRVDHDHNEFASERFGRGNTEHSQAASMKVNDSQRYEDIYVRYLYSGNTRRKRNPLLDSMVVSSKGQVPIYPVETKEPEKKDDTAEPSTQYSDVESDWSRSSCSRSGSLNHNQIVKAKNVEIEDSYVEDIVIEQRSRGRSPHRHVHNYTSLYSMKEIEYFDKEKILAIRRYQFILYVPSLYVILGLLCYYLSDGSSDKGWKLLLYTYPMLQVLSCLILGAFLQILVLSCGGRGVVEESLDVQISANSNYYGCFGSFTNRLCPCFPCLFYENRLKLHDCFLASIRGMGVGIFVLLLTLLTLSEVKPINKKLLEVIDEFYSSLLYVTIFIVALLVLMVLYVTLQVIYSLWEITSLSYKSVWLKTLSIFIIFGGMQLQFVALIIAGLQSEYCATDGVKSCDDNTGCGLCFSASFFVLLMHIDIVIFAFINIFAFDVKDFVRWGKETLPHPNIYKYRHHIDYDKTHDLFNYRKILGPQFLYFEDHPLEDPAHSLPNLKGTQLAVKSVQPVESNDDDAIPDKKRSTSVAGTDAGPNKLFTPEHTPYFRESLLKTQPAFVKSATVSYVPRSSLSKERSPSPSTVNQNTNNNNNKPVVQHTEETEMVENQKILADLLEFPEDREP